MYLRHILNWYLGIFFSVFQVAHSVFEGDDCEQGDAHRRDCVVCLCSMEDRWTCKRDLCDDCVDGDTKTRDGYNYFCNNGRWSYIPMMQLTYEQAVLPFGPCKNEVFKPDWPCNRCRCSAENVWECPLILCREDTMMKQYTPKIKKSKLDQLYEYFNYNGKKETCREEETREGSTCGLCKCEEEVWWCKLKQCPEIDEDTMPDHVRVETEKGVQNTLELSPASSGKAKKDYEYEDDLGEEKEKGLGHKEAEKIEHDDRKGEEYEKEEEEGEQEGEEDEEEGEQEGEEDEEERSAGDDNFD